MNVRDIIELADDLAKTEFFVSDARCRQVLPRGLLRIQVFREGDEARTLLAEYPVFQRTLEGNLVFYWDAQLLALDPGFYLGEFQIDCHVCATLRFRKRTCAVKLDVVQHVYTEQCKPACDAVPGLDGVAVEGCPPTQETGECGATPFPPNQVPAGPAECLPYDGAGVAAQTGSCMVTGQIGLEPGGLCGA